MKNLRESFNSNKSKILLTLAVIWLTNSALIENLNAQTQNNSTNPKMEQVDKNDALLVAEFIKPLKIANIPAEWMPFAANMMHILDQDGKEVAQQLILADLAKIPEQDRLAYILMTFDAMLTAYDKEAHTTAGNAFLDQYLNYETMLITFTKNFGRIRTERTEKNIADGEKLNIEKAKECESKMLKAYQIAPKNETTKILAQETKTIFDKMHYEYSKESAKIFTQLNIK